MLEYLEHAATTCTSLDLTGLADIKIHSESDTAFGLLHKLFTFLNSQGYGWEEHDVFGQTALLYLLKGGGDVSILRLLIDAGADVHATDIFGWNALQCAFEGSRYSRENLQVILALLIAQGVDVHHRDCMGRTPTDWVRVREDWYAFNWCLALERNGLDARAVAIEEWKRPHQSTGGRNKVSRGEKAFLRRLKEQLRTA
jgi:hypothetical protein